MKTSALYWQMVAANSALRQCNWISSEELLEILSELDVASHADLIRQFPLLSKKQAIAAIKLFRILKVRMAGPLLMNCWLSEDTDIRWEAKGALEAVQSQRAYKRLLAFVNTQADVDRCEEACYILAFSFDCSLMKPLQNIYANENFSPVVRAQAAEGLANMLDRIDRRTKPYRQVLPLLLRGLRDPSPEVRFWTCFALGTLRAKEALPELRRVMNEDTALCPDWWYVKDEASDAICHILNKPYPNRERILDSA